ncbi:MAG: hypothetical protein KDC98_09815 [Planctomycetes bacterium]|nr:hypothetical protein [Planctomycetota bacterium]
MKSWFLSCVVVLVIVAMAFASLLGSESGGAEWRQAVRWAEERQRQWQGDGCPVLQGDPGPGCSYEVYREAARLAAALPRSVRDRIAALTEDAPQVGAAAATERSTDAAIDDELIAAVAPIVAEVRRGTRRMLDVSPETPRFGRADGDMIDVIDMRDAMLAVRVTMRGLSSRDAVAATELWIDAMAAALDLGSAGVGVESLIGYMALQEFVEELGDDWLRGCGRPVLASLLAALQGQDERPVPARGFFECDLVGLIAFVEDRPSLSFSDIGVGDPWEIVRHSFSARACIESRVVARLEALRLAELRASPAASWPARKAALEFVAASERASPYSHFMAPVSSEPELLVRKARAALSQLQQAVAFHLGLAVPELPDPLGDAALKIEIDGDEAVFTSAEPAVRRAAVRRAR